MEPSCRRPGRAEQGDSPGGTGHELSFGRAKNPGIKMILQKRIFGRK
jgi:hypothetical protein